MINPLGTMPEEEKTMSLGRRGPGFGSTLRGDMRDYGYNGVQCSGVGCQVSGQISKEQGGWELGVGWVERGQG